jgi:hypothetical protein
MINRGKKGPDEFRKFCMKNAKLDTAFGYAWFMSAIDAIWGWITPSSIGRTGNFSIARFFNQTYQNTIK